MNKAIFPYLIAGLLLGCASCAASQNNDAYALKQQKNLILRRPTHHFQPLLQKGRPPGGSSTDIQYFKDTKSGKNWIGKCTIKSFIGASNYEEYREALGLAIYRFFGIITPEFAVSVQPVAPSVYMIFPHGQRVPVGNKTYLIDKNRPCIHIMTQFLKGFSTCGDAFKAAPQDKHKNDQATAAITDNDSPFMRAYKRAAKAKQPFYLQKNGKKYPLKGLGTMLALANFIYDMDCIGKSGTNLGYLIKSDHAQVVKIDPGMAFSFLEEHTNKKFQHNPMDRKTFFGTDESATLGYDQLTPVDQQAFAAMAKRILQTPRKTLKQLIDSVVVPGGWRKEMANQLLDHLLARKFLFLAAFAPEIDDNLRQEITDSKRRLVATLVRQKDHQKQSKVQIAAYQKALAAVRAWEAKVAANRLIKQKDPKNNQAQKPSSVKEPFQLPNNARGDLFTGRQQDRAAIAAFFGAKRKKACAFQAITGVGGLGKTYLALHYAHACAEGAPWVPHRYDAMLWFYAEAGLDSQFYELAQAWGKKDCKTAQEAVTFVYMALQKRQRTLLVFDNAEQSQSVAPYLPPQHQKGLLDILITTRNPALNLPHYGKPTYITLTAFTKEESRTYIQKVLGHKGCSQQAMDALWEIVSGLPLALNHALQYIAKGECTLAKYPARFAEHQLRLGVQTQTSPVVTSVLLSVLTLREEYPLIEPLLVTAAYLAPEKIPAAAVFTILGIKITKQAKQQALAVLHKYGLLTLAAAGQTFDFHRLVQQVLREWHRAKKGQAGHEALLKDWMAYFEENLEYDDRDIDAIYSISLLIPHAYAIAEADSSTTAIEKSQADLYCQIGGHQCFGVAYYDRAKQCYEKALKIKEKHYGVGHIETASTMSNLAGVLCNLGDYAAAKTYLLKALKIDEKHYGADHPSTASTIENLGIVLDDLGDYAEAKQCYKKALKINAKHYGADHPETASTMMNLGTVLAKLGDYAEAKQYFEKALKIDEKHYGADHPETARTIENLGVVLADLGDYAQAKQCYEKALKIDEKHYGADHPETASTIANLGVVLKNLGDYAQAKQCLEKALKIKEKHYGADHPETAMTMMNLGNVLDDLGEYAKAKQCYEKVLKINEKHYGGDHPGTAMTIANLGNVLCNLGDYAKAKQYYEKALKIQTQYYGADHPSTAMTMGNLGNLFKDLGQYAKGKEYYEKTIAIFTRHYGPNHAMTKQAKRLLTNLEKVAAKSHQKQPKAPQINKVKAQELALIQATCHFVEAMQGQLAKTSVPAYLGSAQWDANAAPNFVAAALGMCRKRQYPNALLQAELHGIPIDLVPFIKAYVDNHPQLQQVAQRPEFCESHLEKPLMLGQYKKARESYQQNIKGSTKHDGANHSEKKPGKRPLASLENGHPKTAETAKKMRDLAIKRQKQGDYLSAAAYYEKALNIFEQHYGTDHPDTGRVMENMGNVLRHLGDYTSAKQYLTKALKIKQQNYGADHPKTALTMRVFGILLDDLGEYAAAQKHLENALKIHKLRYGANDPKTAKTMRALGNVLRNLGDYESAKAYLEKTLKIFEQRYSPTDPSTAIAMQNLGNVLNDLGNYASAKTYLEKALKIFEQHYSPIHLYSAKTMENLGSVLLNQGDYLWAKHYLDKALKIRQHHYGTDHAQTAHTMGVLGLLFKELGQYAKAKECYQKAIKVFTKHYGANHAETKRLKRNLAILEEEVAAQNNKKKPKASLDNPLKNDDENPDDEVFDID